MADLAAPATEEFKDLGYKELEEKIRELRPEMDKAKSILNDRNWTSDENENFGKKAALLTEAGLRLSAMKEEQKKQIELFSNIPDIELSGTPSSQQPAPQNRLPQMNQNGLTPEVQRQLMEQIASQFTGQFGGVQQSNGIPTFRNGMYGQYNEMPTKRLVVGDANINTDIIGSAEYNRIFRNMIQGSLSENHFAADLNASWKRVAMDCTDTDATPSNYTKGGYLITPIQFVDGLQKCCDKLVVMRQLSNVMTVTQASRLGVRRLKERLASFAWSQECERPPRCDVPTGGVKELEPHSWSQCTSVCNALMTRATINVENLLRDELARDLRENLELGYLYGNGIAQPLGIFHRNGLDAETSNHQITLGNFTPSCLLEIACALSSCVDAQWLMSRSAYCHILKTTNGTGDYYWWNLIVQGGPGRGTSRPSLMGYPVNISELATGTFDTVGDFPLVLGDFSSYWIADGPSVGLKRQEDIFANTTCWVARGNTDGMSVNDCDFRRAEIVA